METKTLYEILTEKGYDGRIGPSAQVLAEACLKNIQINGASWYSDVNRGLEKRLTDLYNQEKFFPTLRKRTRKIRDIKDKEEKAGKLQSLNYHLVKKVLEMDDESWHEFDFEKYIGAEDRIISAYVENVINKKVKSSLSNKNFVKERDFKVENIYSILREHYEMDKEGRLRIEEPLYLLDEIGFKKLRKKGKELLSKRIGDTVFEEGRYFDYAISNPIQSGKSDKEIFEEQKKRLKEQILDDIPERYRKLYDVGGNLVSQYRNIATKLPIAYLETGNAIEFFEKETGIDLSQPKEYRKLVFG